MHRRQYLAVTGATLSTGFAGCLGPLGGNEDSGPNQPYIEKSGVSIETNPYRATVPVRNPTDEQVTVRVWIRIISTEGNTLESANVRYPASPTEPDSQTPVVPFTFGEVAYSTSNIDEDATKTALTSPDIEEPPF